MMASLECKERADAPSSTPSTLLLDALAYWVENQPTKKVVTWLDDGGRESTCYTYEQIDQETRSLASYLLARYGLHVT
jgi:acyl-CoA synthetase (AMP-forming)/AMP-acid ligase II